MKNKQWYCRWSPTLGELESTHKKVWGTKTYNPKKHSELPTVFFGVYGLPDFFALWRHKGEKAILWCGTDIQHLNHNYWLEDGGAIVLHNGGMREWINKYCTSYVENVAEQNLLAEMGIDSKIVPSFLGDVNKFKITYEHAERPLVYSSVSGDNFEQYGWDVIERVASKCNVDFHLYGNKAEWITTNPNVFVHGRVPKEQMNEEIEKMQCGLRPLEFDGFSEVLAKAILSGQYAISRIPYPDLTLSYTNDDELILQLNKLQDLKLPNYTSREILIREVNKYPWNKNV